MEKIKLFFKGIFYIILYFILTITLYSIFYDVVYEYDNLMISNMATIFIELLILFIFIIIFRKTIIPDFYDFKKNSKNYLKENYHYYLIGLVIMIVSNVVINFFIQDIATNEEVNREILFTNTLSSIVSMVITAPIIEELITRKIFKDTFKNPWIYILVSGLIFGALHLLVAESFLECLYIIPYAALGAALAKIYYNTNNIWSNIFFHSLHNLIAILLIFWGA